MKDQLAQSGAEVSKQLAAPLADALAALSSEDLSRVVTMNPTEKALVLTREIERAIGRQVTSGDYRAQVRDLRAMADEFERLAVEAEVREEAARREIAS